MTDPQAAGATTSAPSAAVTPDADSRGLWADAWTALRRRPLFWASGSLILLLLVMALFPTLFTSTDPQFAVQAQSTAPPSADAWFGRDLQGRDLYARTIHGAAPTLAVGVLATLGVVIVGSVVGLLAGYRGGWVDSLLSRVGEVFAGLPFILGGIVILITFNPPGQVAAPAVLIGQVVATLVVLSWPIAMRIMRAAAIEARAQDYVKAARALGAGPWRITLRHILPNTLAPVMVYATIALGAFIGAEAALSYLGIGLRDPVVSWGAMIADAQERVQQAPHALFFPAGFLVVTVLAFVMLGDAVRGALDPRSR